MTLLERLAITQQQKKILLIAGIFALSFIVFIVLIYVPSQKYLEHLRGELTKTESEIAQIRTMIGENKPLEEAIRLLQLRLEAIDKRFPDKEETTLRELSALAVRCGLAVDSLRPSRKQTVTDVGGTPIHIRGCFVQEMPVMLSLHGSYRALGEFFRILKDDFPVCVRVNALRITKGENKDAAALSAEAELDTYLINSATM